MDNQMLQIFLKNPAPRARENLADMGSQARAGSIFAPAHLSKIRSSLQQSPTLSFPLVPSTLSFPVGADGCKSMSHSRRLVHWPFLLPFFSLLHRDAVTVVDAVGCGGESGLRWLT